MRYKAVGRCTPSGAGTCFGRAPLCGEVAVCAGTFAARLAITRIVCGRQPMRDMRMCSDTGSVGWRGTSTTAASVAAPLAHVAASSAAAHASSSLCSRNCTCASLCSSNRCCTNVLCCCNITQRTAAYVREPMREHIA
eukprot:365511-Chlamydomonas_euryale.AAC.5